MKFVLRININGEKRGFSDEDFPLAVGINSKGAVVFGGETESQPVAWLGLNNQRIFLQAEEYSVIAKINGNNLADSAWLAAEDKIQINNAKLSVNIESGVLVLSSEIQRKTPTLTPLKTNGQAKSKQYGSITHPKTDEKNPDTKPKHKTDDAKNSPSKISTAPTFAKLPGKEDGSKYRRGLIGFFYFYWSVSFLF